MAAYNITADPEYGDFMSLAPDSLRRKRIDQLAGNIYASMYEGGRTPPRGQQRSSADTTQGRGDEARKVALKQAIAQEQKENAAAPNFTALDRGVGAQDTTREPGISLPPEPTIESETVKPTATGLTSDQLTRRILDQDAALAKEEASRLPLPAAAAPATGGNMMTPVGPVGAPAAQAMPDTGTAPTDEPYKSLLERVAPSLYRSADEDITGTTFPTVDSETSKQVMPTGKTNAELRQDILDQEAALQEEIATGPPIPTPTGKSNAELRENMLRQDMALKMEVEGERNRSQRPDIGGLPEGAVEVPDLPEAQGPGLLSRLGGFAQNNPELLAQIAQAGGGFMQNIAQGRAQKKADAKTRGAMAQSNLIGALTGGKSRPAVMREEAEQGGLLARLGQAVQAGGSVAGGEMKRRTALSQRDEEMDLKGRKVAAGERQGDLMSRRLGIMQDKINKEYEINDKAAQVALAKATGASYERVQGGIESLNKATNIYKGGGYLDPTQGAKNLYGQMRVLYNDYDKDATPANVGAIFQVYQRFFDPATVREGDLKILQEAEGTFRRIQAQAERLVGAGGSLSSDTVEEMKRITDKVHSMQARKATEDVNAYISTALDPRDREATSEYYDRIFKMPSLSDSGDKGDLVKDLGQTEIKL